jgi:hypothetical protein
MSFVATVLRMSSGVIVWALHFAAIYGFTALACARGWGSLVPGAVALASAAALVALMAVVVAGWRRRGEFESWMSAALGGFAFLAIVYEAITVLIIPACT